MVSILLQNLLITRQVHIKTLTQGGTYLAKSTDAKLEIQFSSDADKMWVEEYPLTCMYAERGMLDMMGFISGEQELAKQGGGEGGGRGPSTKVKWGQGWNNDKHTSSPVFSYLSLDSFETGISELAVSLQFETL